MSVRTHNNGARKPLRNQIVAPGLYAEATLAGNLTLDEFSAQWLKLDPDGTHRDITLPAVEDGLYFHIVNTAGGAENLVVKNAAGSTIGTVNQNEEGIFVSTSSAWKLLRIATIGQS